MPPATVSSVNQPSAAMNALVSGFTTLAEPGAITSTSARGATLAQTEPGRRAQHGRPRDHRGEGDQDREHRERAPARAGRPGAGRPPAGAVRERERDLIGSGHSAQQGT